MRAAAAWLPPNLHFRLGTSLDWVTHAPLLGKLWFCHLKFLLCVNFLSSWLGGPELRLIRSLSTPVLAAHAQYVCVNSLLSLCTKAWYLSHTACCVVSKNDCQLMKSSRHYRRRFRLNCLIVGGALFTHQYHLLKCKSQLTDCWMRPSLFKKVIVQNSINSWAKHIKKK